MSSFGRVIVTKRRDGAPEICRISVVSVTPADTFWPEIESGSGEDAMFEISVEVGMVLKQSSEFACDIIVNFWSKHGNCSYTKIKRVNQREKKYNRQHTVAKTSNTADSIRGDEASQLGLIVQRVGDVARALAIVRETNWLLSA